MSRRLLIISATAVSLLAAVSFLAIGIFNEDASEISPQSAAAPNAPAPETLPSDALIKEKFLAAQAERQSSSLFWRNTKAVPAPVATNQIPVITIEQPPPPEPFLDPQLVNADKLPDGLEPFFDDTWIRKPSPALVAKLGHWRFKIESKGPQDVTQPSDPAKGLFAWWSLLESGTARLASDRASNAAISWTQVEKGKTYVAELHPNQCCETAMTPEFSALLRGPEIASILTRLYLRYPGVDVEKDAQSITVQEFDATVRVPGKKERIWSIGFYVRNDRAYRGGFDVWGLFTRVNGVLKPFYLVGMGAPSDGAIGPFPSFDAIGDLDGDGIDEMIGSELDYEPEGSNLVIFSWEDGVPVRIFQQSF